MTMPGVADAQRSEYVGSAVRTIHQAWSAQGTLRISTFGRFDVYAVYAMRHSIASQSPATAAMWSST